MSPVFLDTVGILALLDEDDQWHLAAANAFQRITNERKKTLTTEFVLLECGNASARRPYRADISALLKRLKSRKMLIEITSDDLEAAWNAFDRGEAAEAGIVDQVSFAVMRRLDLSEAFTNDRHFRAAGFSTLF